MHGGTEKTQDLPRVYFFGLNKRARRRRRRLRARLILRRGICPEAFFRHMPGSIFTCKHGRFLRRLEKVFYGPAMACFSCKEGPKKDARPQARAPFCINKKRARSAFGSGLCLARGTGKDAALTRASYRKKEESPERDLRVEALDCNEGLKKMPTFSRAFSA